MSNIRTDFKWDGGVNFEVLSAGPLSSAAANTIGGRSFRPSETLHQKTHLKTSRRPLDARENLWLDFANLDGSADQCLLFAKRWGLLTTAAAAGASEPLSLWRHHITTMRLNIEGLKAGTVAVPKSGWSFARFEAKLLPSKTDGRLSFVVTPQTLLDGLWLQFSLEVSAQRMPNTCEKCGEFFAVGVGAGGKRKRIISRFCSDACKNAYNNPKRKSGAKAGSARIKGAK